MNTVFLGALTTKLNMPKKEDDKKQEMEVVKSGLLTILIGKGDQIYHYEGELDAGGANFMTDTYPSPSNPGIRKVIQDKKAQVVAAHVHNEACKKIWEKNNGDQNSCLDRDLVVVIKPNPEANYGRTVDILDEMTINKVERYAVIDITPEENTVLGLAAQRNPGK